MTLKEQAIRKYITNIDFKSNEWGITSIKEDMKKFLGEEPAIDLTYIKDVMLNEKTGKPQEILNIEKIKIVFFDLDEKFKKIEFLIG